MSKEPMKNHYFKFVSYFFLAGAVLAMWSYFSHTIEDLGKMTIQQYQYQQTLNFVVNLTIGWAAYSYYTNIIKFTTAYAIFTAGMINLTLHKIYWYHLNHNFSTMLSLALSLFFTIIVFKTFFDHKKLSELEENYKDKSEMMNDEK